MPLEGTQVGHYQLQRFIGSGAMGEVYLAEDARISRQVAVKIVRNEVNPYPDAQATSDALRLFQREMKAVATLDHPNILPLFDFGEQTINKTVYVYMVMPFRAEGSLVDWLQQRNSSTLLAPQEVVHIVSQAADALQHVHNRHLTHLDVKPSNFLIRRYEDSSRRPDVLLADFGIARFSTVTSTASQTVRGTPPYMAPEQWASTPVAATDQYALAIMAYQLLTRRFPFEGNMQQVMYKHLQERPQPPSAFNPRIPPDVDMVILRALEKKPEDRFSSIHAFATAFEQAWHAGGTTQRSPLPPTRYAMPPTEPVFQPASPPVAPAQPTPVFQVGRTFAFVGMVIGVLVALLGVLWLTAVPGDAQNSYHNDFASGTLMLFSGLMLFFIARIRKRPPNTRKTESLIGRITSIVALLCGILALFKVGGPGGLDWFPPYDFGLATILVGIIILWVTAI